MLGSEQMMESKSIDPRIVRTKQLLVDAFLKISREKKLSQITVKDITDIATLNRATFYAHFTDKEDLLDYTLSVTILKDLNDNLSIFLMSLMKRFCVIFSFQLRVISKMLQSLAN